MFELSEVNCLLLDCVCVCLVDVLGVAMVCLYRVCHSKRQSLAMLNLPTEETVSGC